MTNMVDVPGPVEVGAALKVFFSFSQICRVRLQERHRSFSDTKKKGDGKFIWTKEVSKRLRECNMYLSFFCFFVLPAWFSSPSSLQPTNWQKIPCEPRQSRQWGGKWIPKQNSTAARDKDIITRVDDGMNLFPLAKPSSNRSFAKRWDQKKSNVTSHFGFPKHISSQRYFEDDFPSPKVGYVS